MKKVIFVTLSLIVMLLTTSFLYKADTVSGDNFSITKNHLNDVNQDLYVIIIKKNSMKLKRLF